MWHLQNQIQDIYLQDSLTNIIVDPFLPITRPIFPGGTSKTDRISTSGTWTSAAMSPVSQIWKSIRTNALQCQKMFYRFDRQNWKSFVKELKNVLWTNPCHVREDYIRFCQSFKLVYRSLSLHCELQLFKLSFANPWKIGLIQQPAAFATAIRCRVAC